MSPEEVIDIGKDAIWVMLKVSLPLMVISLVVGLVIALFQALTQIQEMTLSFVPKIIAVFVSLLLLMPFMIDTLKDFNERIAERIIGVD